MWKNVTWAFVAYDCSPGWSGIEVDPLLSVQDVSSVRVVPAADKKLVRKRKSVSKSVSFSGLKGVAVRSRADSVSIPEGKQSLKSGSSRKSGGASQFLGIFWSRRSFVSPRPAPAGRGRNPSCIKIGMRRKSGASPERSCSR
jgi:hypothetical protein